MKPSVSASAQVKSLFEIKVSILGLAGRQQFCQLMILLRVVLTFERLVCFHMAVDAELGTVREFQHRCYEFLNFFNLKLRDQTAGRKQSVPLKSPIRLKLVSLWEERSRT